MSKYDPLGHFLRGLRAPEASMTFAEVEAVLGFSLPASAFCHAAWWSNNAANNLMTGLAKRRASNKKKVDLNGRKVVFRRVKPAVPAVSPALTRANVLETLRKRLCGIVTIQKGYDLCTPLWGPNNPKGDSPS